jgi:hypothetical protein
MLKPISRRAKRREQWALRRKIGGSIRISRSSGRPFLRTTDKDPQKKKMAENNAGREERPETGSEEESSRDYSTGSEGTVGEAQATEEERIAQAIEGKGEILSEELKKLLREIEVVQGLRAGTLGRSLAPRSHRAISGEAERSAQRRNREAGRKIQRPKRKGRC